MEIPLISGKSARTAVQRTPVEVWQMTLLLAVESPLRPRNGDNVLDGKIVFSTCCHSRDRHDRVAALRTRLRLVCQEWNAILKDAGHHIAFIERGYLDHVEASEEQCRRIRRIEAVRLCGNCAQFFMTRTDREQEPASFVPPDDTQWVESLLLSNECKTDIEYQFVMKVLDTAIRLRALEILDDQLPRESFTNILNHQSLTRVTHLSIGLLGVGHEGQVYFPAVQHLRLTLSHRRPQEPVPDWLFPSLTSFHLYRDEPLRVPEGNLFAGLDRFIALHGRNITSLLIGYSTMGSDCETSPCLSEKKFWTWFPNLRLFGPAMGALGSFSSPPKHSNLTALAIPGRHSWGSTIGHFPCDTFIEDLLETCNVLNIKKLFMTDLWEEIGNGEAYRIRETSYWSITLFEEAAAEGIEFFDSDGIPISDPEGQQFLHRLRDSILDRTGL